MNLRKALKWLLITETIAHQLSKDDSTQVAAVVLDKDWGMLSQGYNGPPRGVNDDVPERKQRPEKYLWNAHAEENAIVQAARKGIALEGGQILMVGLFPCAACARMIVQAGIKTVYVLMPEDPVALERWQSNTEVSLQMFKEAGVDLHAISRDGVTVLHYWPDPTVH